MFKSVIKKVVVAGCTLCIGFTAACEGEEYNRFQGDQSAMGAVQSSGPVDGWTKWFDRDNPSGTGDWESGFNDPCQGNTPIHVLVETVDGIPYQQTGETLHIDPKKGAVCKKNEQSSNSCKDYHVKFFCSDDPSDVEYISPTALTEVETWEPKIEVGGSYDYGIMPHLIPNTKTGDILQTISVTTSHNDFKNRIPVIRISKDGGVTWTSPDGDGDNMVVNFFDDGKKVDISGGGSTPSGRYIVFFRAFQNGQYEGNYYSYSDDNGKTWSKPILQHHNGNYNHDTRFLTGENKELIYAQVQNVVPLGQPRRAVVFESVDNGLTWQQRSIALEAARSKFNISELVMRDFGDGVFVMIGRLTAIDIADGEFKDMNLPFMLTSTDYGRTWADGTETLTEENISFDEDDSGKDGLNTAGWLPLEGKSINLGDATKQKWNNVLPSLERVDYNGETYILIGYYLRDDVLPLPNGDGREDEVMRLTAVKLSDWLQHGWKAIKKDVAITIHQNDDSSQGQYDGNGTLYVPGNRPEALFILCDNLKTSPGGPEVIHTGRIDEAVITDLLDAVDNAPSISE